MYLSSPVSSTWVLKKCFFVIFLVVSIHPSQISSYAMLCKALCEKHRTTDTPYTLNCYDLLANDLLDCRIPCSKCPEMCTEQSFHKAYSCPGRVGKSVEIWRSTDETKEKEKSISDASGHLTIMIGNDKITGIAFLTAIVAIGKCIFCHRTKKSRGRTRAEAGVGGVGVTTLQPDMLLQRQPNPNQGPFATINPII